MTDILAQSDTIGLRGMYASVVPPTVAAQACCVCRGCRSLDSLICETCSLAASELGALATVVPISLYAKPSPLRDILTYYKPGREVFQPRFVELLSHLLKTFLGSRLLELSDLNTSVDGATSQSSPQPSTERVTHSAKS